MEQNNNNIRADLLGEDWDQGQQQQNENFEVDGDDDDGPDRERDVDGVLDGGVAPSEKGAAQERRSSDCDLVRPSWLVAQNSVHPVRRSAHLVIEVEIEFEIDRTESLVASFTTFGHD